MRATCAFMRDTLRTLQVSRAYTAEISFEPSKLIYSLFHQDDDKRADLDRPFSIPATSSATSTRYDSTSRRQSLFVPEDFSEESDESSSLDSEFQQHRFLQL